MTLHIVTADERLSAANSKTTAALFGPAGVGKTSLIKSMPAEPTLCIDLVFCPVDTRAKSLELGED
jgi:putative ribosome biogenesis GTPase RsgA